MKEMFKIFSARIIITLVAQFYLPTKRFACK